MTNHECIAFARDLIEAGIPCVVVGPGDKPRQSWANLTPEQCDLSLFRDGDAIAMVTGHGLDVVDVDPKNGGTLDGWPTDFVVYGQTNTPSGGYHLIVASTGVGTMRLDGVGDYCGGHADGTSRGLAFLPGSRRTKYPDGGYEAESDWDLDTALMIGTDVRLREALLEHGGTLERPARAALVVDGVLRDPALGVHPQARELIDAEIGRLKACQDGGDYWDNTTYQVACNLIELANTPWTGYPLEQAEADLMQWAPTDADFGEYRHRQKWESALTRVGGQGVERVVPADEDFEVVEGEPERRPLPTTSLEDDALAERIGPVVADRLLAWGSRGWAMWDGRRWDTAVPADPVLRIVANALEDVMWAETDQAMVDRRASMALGGDGKAELKRMNSVAKLMAMSKVKTVTEALRTRISRRLEDFDTAVWALNVGNGVVDLRTGELGPHDRSLMFTQMTPVRYVPGARHLDWDKALRALPSEVAEWMRLRFGQAAIGAPPLDTVVPFLKGGGENGKSTLLDAVSAALGEFAHMASEKVVLGQNNEHSTETYALKGRRLVYIEELPEGNWVNVTRIKKLSGTGKMNARPMREDPVEWTPTHSLMISTNHNTQIGDTDHATWRRLARVEFPYTFTGAERDRSLRSRVQQGAAVEAVLAWVVSGAVDVHRAGGEMPMPAVVEADTEAWRLGSNYPAEFIGEALELREGAAVPSELVFRMYRQWAKEKGHVGNMRDQTFWDRASQHRWFIDGRIQKKVARPGAYEMPDGVKSEGTLRMVLGVTVSDVGDSVRQRMRDMF